MFFPVGLDDDIQFDRLLVLDLSPVNPTRCILFSLSRPEEKRSSFVFLVGVGNTAISTLEPDVRDDESGKCACK